MNRARSRRRGKRIAKFEEIISKVSPRKHSDTMETFKIWVRQLDESLWAGWINKELRIAILLNYPLDGIHRWGDIVSVVNVTRTTRPFHRTFEYLVIGKLLKR